MKLYSDPKYKTTDRHIVLLYPFWGGDSEGASVYTSRRYADFIAMGKSLFEMTPLAEADAAVFPSPWEAVRDHPEAIQVGKEFTAMASAAGKPTIIFFWDDLTEPVPLKDAVVFRTSMYKSKQQRNEYVMPSFCEDFVEEYCQGKLPLREKQDKPVVGFCGQAHAPSLRPAMSFIGLKWQLRYRLRHGEFDTSRRLRARVLHPFMNNPRVTANFIIRQMFMGGVLQNANAPQAQRFQSLRQEFVDNMINSDYGVCVRGSGNFSHRFYETLSCGRIPVFVNTDCGLPFDDEINYRDYCVWIEQKDVPRAAEIVADFHARLSPKQFTDLQHECRRLWEQYLSPVGFFQHFHRHLL